MERSKDSHDDYIHPPLRARFSSLKNEEKNKFFAYLRNLKDQEGEMFEEFLEANPELVEILLGQ